MHWHCIAVDNLLVHGCLFVACFVLFAWRLCVAALLCLVCLIVGERFRTITCRQIRWHIHQFVRVHIPWHNHQTRDWTKDVKRFSLSLSKIIRKFSSSFWTFLRSSTFDLCLLQYAGWLKHCNSLSLSKTLFSLSLSAILLMTLLLVCRCDRRLDQAFCICSRSSLCLGLWCQRSIFCLTEMYDTRQARLCQ